MKFPYQRLAQLFAIIQNEMLPQAELALRLMVSARTVRTDISVLNELLMHHGAQLVLLRKKGYQIEVTDTIRYQQLLQETPSFRGIPRTSTGRVNYLLARFMVSPFSLKLEDLAEEWFVSRTTLQGDMAEVRAWFSRYPLIIETRPYYGMKLFGTEAAIRTSLTDLLYQTSQENSENPQLSHEVLSPKILAALQPELHQIFSRFGIGMTDDSEHYLHLYFAVAAWRISEGYPVSVFSAEDVDDDVRYAARDIARQIQVLTHKTVSSAEEAYFRVNIAARRVQVILPSTISADDSDSLVDYLLHYINHHYNFNLQNDPQLRADLLTHVKTMITRARYQINIPNPLLDNIRQHYPLAYDITLAAVASWSKHTPYFISENETGFLVLHIGVGLERHYDVGYQRNPQILLVCDTGNSMVRMLQAMLIRHYPQIGISSCVSQREYDAMNGIEADFVISTVRLAKKEKPVVVISPFPTDYQLAQIGKLVLVDRTRPYMLEKFFDQPHFMIVDNNMDQSQLFGTLCSQLEREEVVDTQFRFSVEEREAIVSTMLGEGIALPHALGLLAKRSVVFTVLAPQGIPWGEEKAYVIFLLALSKTEYEQAMAIYDLFVTLVRERAMERLRACPDFDSFKTVALDCLARL